MPIHPMMSKMAPLSRLAALAFLCCLTGPAPAQDEAPAAPLELSPGTGPKHAIAMHGEPLHGPDFTHYDYVNPDAPKGGKLVIVGEDTFDNLNPFIVPPGNPMVYMRYDFRVFESLTTRGRNEPFTIYGLLAETIEVPDDRSWVSFTIRKEAKFADGTPVTVDDVIFSFEALKEHGWPYYRNRYKNVIAVNRIGERTVQFVFRPDLNDREMALIMGFMFVFPKHYYDRPENDFSKTTLKPPLGSGPYRIADVDPGRSVTFERREDYWGWHLPVRRGRHNFDEVRYEYFRDKNTAFEAFKAGEYHVYSEIHQANINPTQWARGFNFGAVNDGRIKRKEFEHGRSQGMLGFALNTRRAKLSDIRVRKALVKAFDFDWINRNFFYGNYRRTTSFFQNSYLAARGPASDAERALLAPFPDAVDPEIMENGWVPASGGDYYDRVRDKLTDAIALFREAGYEVRDGIMVNTETGAPYELEVMIQRVDYERIALAYKAELAKIGVNLKVRLVDPSQFQSRQNIYDFDMMPFEWRGSLSPGNEQSYRWGSTYADGDGNYNFSGVKNPAVDAMIDALLAARTREQLVTASRALDRVLLSGYYVVPLYHIPTDRVAWWQDVEGPDELPLYGFMDETLETWWSTHPDSTAP